MKEISSAMIILGVVVVVMVLFLIGLLQNQPVLVRPNHSREKKPEVALQKLDTAIASASSASSAEAPTLLKPQKTSMISPRERLALWDSQGATASFTLDELATLTIQMEKEKDLKQLFRVAMAYESLSDFSTAHRMYMDLLEKEVPPHLQVPLLKSLGAVSVRINKPDDAILAYSRLVDKQPALLESYVELFKIVSRHGSFELIAQLRKSGDAYHGDHFDYNFWLGKAYALRKRPHESIECFLNCLKSQPRNATVRLLLVHLYRKQGITIESLIQLEALMDMRDAIPESVNFPLVLWDAAVRSTAIKRHDLAFRYLRSALLEDRSLLAHDDKGFINTVAVAVSHEGNPGERVFVPVFMAYVNGEYQRAMRDMEAILPTLTDANLKKDGKRLIEECRSILAADQQRLVQANASGKSGKVGGSRFPKKPGDAAGNISSGTISVGIRSSKVHSTVSGQLSGHSSSQASPGAMPLREWKPSPENLETINRIKDEAAIRSDNGASQFIAGVQLLRYKEIDEAKKYFEGAIALDPNISEAYYELARIAITRGDAQEVVDHLERAIEVNPKNAKFKSMLASTLLETGDPGGAFEYAREATTIDADNVEGYLVMAKILLARNKTTEAWATINKGLAAEKAAPAGLKGSLTALLNQLPAEETSP